MSLRPASTAAAAEVKVEADAEVAAVAPVLSAEEQVKAFMAATAGFVGDEPAAEGDEPTAKRAKTDADADADADANDAESTTPPGSPPR